ncbi:TLD-domain-containing protein [Polychytrium aggregatum]|uniref:TLD-domain-containing protein n=1 Tax=Polychytrium aggregatum TaxID=110093 RepID=UPI0022FDBE52|nr:TLD-domain-containing protein [Polychytrium aggregatum]KAI9206253.1 TLD-domain-containing protein [Polychytrium aggregatum]
MSLIDIKRPPVRLEGRNSDLEGILLPPVVEKIRPHLPPFLRESSTWILSYSLDQHGISLNTLYRRSEENGPSLVVIRDGDGGTFGAFASEALHIEPTYFGNGECFLWKLSDDGDIQVYPATGANEYLIYGEPHMFAFGGGQGRFGLWISDDLYNGHSEPCDTFKNAQLSAKSEFIVVAIEIWSFKI